MAQQNNQRPDGENPYQRRGSHFAPSSDQQAGAAPRGTHGSPAREQARPRGSRFEQGPAGTSGHQKAASNPYSRSAYAGRISSQGQGNSVGQRPAGRRFASNAQEGARADGAQTAHSAAASHSSSHQTAGPQQSYQPTQAYQPVPAAAQAQRAVGYQRLANVSAPVGQGGRSRGGMTGGSGLPPVSGGYGNGAPDGNGGSPKRSGRGTTIAAIVLLVVGLALLGTALGIYLMTQHNYQVGKDEYAALAQNVTEDTATSRPIVDFATLKADNPEVVAWVQIPGTPVNYPVAQHSDNDYYLEHTFTDQYNLAGSVFLDYRSAADASGYTTAIYGHHLKNGEMFAKIADYSDQAEFDAIPGVYYVTSDNTVHDLVPIGAIVVDGGETDVLQFDFASDADFQAYVQGLLDRCSARRTDVDLSGVTHLYMLSTCSYERENDRTILLAVDRSQAGVAAHDASQDIEDIRSAADQAVSVVTGEPVPTEGETTPSDAPAEGDAVLTDAAPADEGVPAEDVPAA